ncbi:MAG: HAD-IB family hydrolase [Pseudomonadota bacterium]
MATTPSSSALMIHRELIDGVLSGPKGPSVAAIFDFDGTIIAGYSATVFMREQLKRGDFQVSDLSEMAAVMTRFGIGDIGFSAMMASAMQYLRGTSEADYQAFANEVFHKYIARLIYPETRALIEAHQSMGHTLAIVSSATPHQISAAADELGIEHRYSTELEVVDGSFTGQVVRPTCFGPGKVIAAHDLCDKTGTDLAKSYFYSDSFDDIELLEAVRWPRVINPNRPLREVAESREWPIYRFRSRGRAKASEWIRSAAATGSLAASFVAGLPILALTRSRRKMQNFSLAMFTETASALIGLELEIRGEANLWQQRPAVFVFNHQSKADLLVILKLLRQDVAGVGKKELRNMPIIGQVLELGGAVLIDRKNSASAIEAMKPLVDVMQKDGKSVVIAPEGTRSVTGKLLPFKKGAFHLARQAGVPIVPVVIHNSMDVAPKGDFVFRPATVVVDVLKPISTKRWTAKNMAKQVEAVRQQFLKTLGQTDGDDMESDG